MAVASKIPAARVIETVGPQPHRVQRGGSTVAVVSLARVARPHVADVAARAIAIHIRTQRGKAALGDVRFAFGLHGLTATVRDGDVIAGERDARELKRRDLHRDARTEVNRPFHGASVKTGERHYRDVDGSNEQSATSHLRA